MSTLKIQERFSLDAPIELVWRHLIDPARTVVCLPGAQITGQEDERTYRGRMKVKLGTVTVSYRGKLTFEQIDEERRYVRMVGKGREKSGSGSVTLTMEGRVIELDGGATEVVVDSDVRLTGKIVRFGRGMIEAVSAEVFKEFRVRLAEKLRGEVAARRASAAEGEAGAHGADGRSQADVADEGPPAVRPRAESDDALPLFPLLLRACRAWLVRLFRGG